MDKNEEKTNPETVKGLPTFLNIASFDESEP
jgi:hypothetical protein